MERTRLKLETPIVIAERLLSACETLVNQDCQYAKQDLTSATEIIDCVKECATELENESISWRRKTMLVSFPEKMFTTHRLTLLN